MIKKVLMFSFVFCGLVFAYEPMPLMIDTSVVDVKIENANDLIKSDKMKKSKSIEKAKSDLNEIQPPIIQLDLNQIHHQRTLDYMNNRNGSMMPIF